MTKETRQTYAILTLEIACKIMLDCMDELENAGGKHTELKRACNMIENKLMPVMASLHNRLLQNEEFPEDYWRDYREHLSEKAIEAVRKELERVIIVQ